MYTILILLLFRVNCVRSLLGEGVFEKHCKHLRIGSVWIKTTCNCEVLNLHQWVLQFHKTDSVRFCFSARKSKTSSSKNKQKSASNKRLKQTIRATINKQLERPFRGAPLPLQKGRYNGHPNRQNWTHAPLASVRCPSAPSSSSESKPHKPYETRL